MANGEVYGGQAWTGDQLQALIQAVMQQLQYAGMTGWTYPAMYEPEAPTRNEALSAIWNNRPDIQAFYRQNWGDPAKAKGDLKNWRPEDAVENWLGMTGELTPEQKADPIGFAIEQGWLVDYTAVEREPTLARLQYLRSLGLDEEAAKNLVKEWDYREKRDAVEDEQWQKTMDRWESLDEEDRRRYQQDRADQLAQRAIENDQWNMQFEADTGFRADQLELARAELKWREEQGWANIGLGQQELGLGYLGLLSQLRGPEDWLTYWNVQRAAEPTELPAFARALAEGTGLAPWQAPAPGIAAAPAPGLPAAGGVSGLESVAATGVIPPFAAPLPQQVTPQQWFNMYPSERAGLGGWVEEYGGYMPDYLQQMQRAWPTGQAQGVSYFG